MFFINPFIYGGAGGDYESIATVTVGSGGASSIEFTSIPASYQHLQIRVVNRGTYSSLSSGLNINLGNGSIDTGSNYASHRLYVSGSSVFAAGYSDMSTLILGQVIPAATSAANLYGTLICDVLDYANTSKNTTVRAVGANPLGNLEVTSGLWMNTQAVDSIQLKPDTNSWAQHTTAALYGIKAP